jgi:hypothetical protein
VHASATGDAGERDRWSSRINADQARQSGVIIADISWGADWPRGDNHASDALHSFTCFTGGRAECPSLHVCSYAWANGIESVKGIVYCTHTDMTAILLPRLERLVHHLETELDTNKGRGLYVSAVQEVNSQTGKSYARGRTCERRVQGDVPSASPSAPLFSHRHFHNRFRAPSTHISRESPSHSRPEAFPQRRDPIRSDELPRAVQETRVRPMWGALQSRLDRLRSALCPHSEQIAQLTSGGIAIAHMPTPAAPPARITAPMLNGGAGASSPFGSRLGEGESLRLMSSYVAK